MYKYVLYILYLNGNSIQQRTYLFYSRLSAVELVASTCRKMLPAHARVPNDYGRGLLY